MTLSNVTIDIVEQDVFLNAEMKFRSIIMMENDIFHSEQYYKFMCYLQEAEHMSIQNITETNAATIIQAKLVDKHVKQTVKTFVKISEKKKSVPFEHLPFRAIQNIMSYVGNFNVRCIDRHWFDIFMNHTNIKPAMLYKNDNILFYILQRKYMLEKYFKLNNNDPQLSNDHHEFWQKIITFMSNKTNIGALTINRIGSFACSRYLTHDDYESMQWIITHAPNFNDMLLNIISSPYDETLEFSYYCRFVGMLDVNNVTVRQIISKMANGNGLSSTLPLLLKKLI